MEKEKRNYMRLIGINMIDKLIDFNKIKLEVQLTLKFVLFVEIYNILQISTNFIEYV